MAHEMHTRRRRRSQLPGSLGVYTFIRHLSGCIYLGVYTFIRHLSGCIYIYLGVYTFIWVYIHLSDIYLGVYIWVYIHLSDRPEGFRRLRLDTIKVVQLSLVDAALVQGFF